MRAAVSRIGSHPAIVYGGAAGPQAVELDHNALWHALKKEAARATVLDMELTRQGHKGACAMCKCHAFKQMVLHVDFQRVDANTKLHMKVPLHYSGDENSPGSDRRLRLPTTS